MRTPNPRRLTAGAVIAIAVAILAGIAAGADARADAPERIAVARAGDAGGRTVLFVPGLGTPGAVWDDTVFALGDIDAHVVTLAGFGGRPPAGPGPVIAPAVDALAGYVEAQDLTDVVVVGHSLGGQIALQLAAAEPARIAEVVVVDSAPFYARLFNPAITPDQAAAWGQGVAAQMAAMDREAYLAQIRQGLPVQSLTAAGQAQVMAWMDASDQTTVATAFGEVAGSDFTPVLDDVAADVTVLVAWAEGAPMDAAALADIYRAQYDPLDSVRVDVIDGSRHFVMLDRPVAFAGRLSEIVSPEEAE